MARWYRAPRELRNVRRMVIHCEEPLSAVSRVCVQMEKDKTISAECLERLWAFSLTVTDRDRNIHHGCGVVEADNGDEARGTAQQWAERDFPRSLGFHDHQIQVHKASRFLLER
jgi:hypothetical protein